jgi:hypothetical protein
MWAVLSEFVTSLVRTDGKGVDKDRGARCRPEGRLEDHRSIYVSAFHLSLINWRDRPVTRLVIEDAGKSGWSIETWEAQPID